MHTLPLTYLLYASSSIHALLTMALALLTSRLTIHPRTAYHGARTEDVTPHHSYQAVMSEVHALRHLSGHENIVRLIDVVELAAGMPHEARTPG